MGIIYRKISPNGKSYIGQTVNSMKTRDKDHMHDYREFVKLYNDNKLDEFKGCRALYSAYNEYGVDDFTTEILITCDDNELDDYEIYFIEFYNTLSPNGYNLTTGGCGKKKLSEETKLLISERTKKAMQEKFVNRRIFKDELKELPIYVSFRQRNNMRGYRILNHPLCKAKEFISDTESLESLKEKTLKFLEELETKNIPYESNKKAKANKGLEKGVRERRNGNYMGEVIYKNIRYRSPLFNNDIPEINLQKANYWVINKRNELKNQK